MPRKPRFFVPGIPVHVVQRGHSRQAVFFESQDYATYAYWVKESALKYGISIHAFVLMTNHVHLLLTPSTEKGVSDFMQYVGRRYVPYINHKYGRSGTIWEGRFKASMVQDDRYLLAVMRYIEMNPVRAGMVDLPGHYRWSSFLHNSGARKISFISHHEVYNSLGKSKEIASQAYVDLFRGELSEQEMKRINEAWKTGTPLGNDSFRKQIEGQLGCKVGYARRGRPVRRGRLTKYQESSDN